MTDVFVSYSRRDQDGVRDLVAELERRGRTVWLDTEGIGDGEVFPEAIRAAIEGADAFLFVISPDSVASRFCETEVEYAVSLHKRLIPILRAPVADELLPEAIRVRSWVPYTSDVGAGDAADRLIGALDTDLEYVRAHTRWLLKAREWEAEGRDRSLLLRGGELRAAEAWLAEADKGSEPGPTAQQRELVAISRAKVNRRQRILVLASLAVAAVSVVLLVFALISRNQAVSAQGRATSAAKRATEEASVATQRALVSRSRLLAAESEAQLTVDPERSILLAMAAVRRSPTNEAVFALRQALDRSPLRLRLATVRLRDGFLGPGIAYSPDGRELAVGSQHGAVVIVDAATGDVRQRLELGALAPLLAFRPDGAELAVTTNKDLELVNLKTGTKRLIAQGDIGNPVYSSDGERLYYADGAHVVRFDVGSGNRRVLVAAGTGGIGTSGLYVLSLSPDGKRLAAGGSPGIELLSTASGRVLATAASAHGVNAVVFSRSGSELAVAESPTGSSLLNEGDVVVLDGRTLAPRGRVARVVGTTYTALSFAPDGQRLAIGAADGSAGIYSVSGVPLVALPGHTTLIWDAAFSPDGKDVVTAANDGTVVVWRASGGDETTIDTGGFVTGASGNNYVMTDLRLLADRIVVRFAPTAGPGSGYVVVETWTRGGLPAGEPLILGPAQPDYFARLSADGRYAAAVVGYDTSQPVRVWDVVRRRIERTLRPGVAVGAVGPAISAGGHRVALAGPAPGNELTVDSLGHGQAVKLGRVSCDLGWGFDAFSPDGQRLATTTGCGDVQVWSAATGRREGSPASFGNFFNIGPTSFSPSGARLAIANSGNDGQVSILDIASGRIVAVLTEHTKQVQDITYSPDGTLLATASLDGTARVWDARTGTLLRVLPHPDAVNNVAFSPDGRLLATLDFAGRIRIWDACSACGNPAALLRLAETRVTRRLTARERLTFGVD